MKQLVLSDHTQHKAREAAARREADYQAGGHTYQAILDFRRRRRAEAQLRLRYAWRGRQWSAVLRDTLLILFHSIPRELLHRPRRREASLEEKMWEVGAEGERRVVSHLAKHFGNEWVLVSGYRNRGGEIDQILVGPGGIFAMEVKHINGEVHCNGDEWWRDKYDRYGNLVEKEISIADKGGRAPSRQLNDAADVLEAFLAREGGEVKIHRTVVLSHKSSKVGKLKKLTIDQVVTLEGWKPAKVFGRSQTFGTTAVGRIVQAIQKDHEFHNRPRRQR